MTRFDEPIFVTRPYLPPLDEFMSGCEEIWRNRWLTNDGPMLARFHAELARRLDVPTTNLALFCNGTLALELGYQAMGLAGGEVITTPFTFVATAHALVRAGAKPVFADVDPETLCLDPVQVEKLIRPGVTKAIVPVHVYGNVCDTAGFDRLSEKYGIPVIYDAAHAFGIRDIEKRGAMSMFSFHPTKLFHACEGGCLVFRDAALQKRLFNLRNFAIESETECEAVGSNAKMNELQALMGLKCLEKIDEILSWRHAVAREYATTFADSRVRWVGRSANDAYCPVLFESFALREKVYAELKDRCNVFSRRYFYPLLTDFAPYSYAKGTCPMAEDAAARVLTLPTYYGLSPEDARDIARNVLEIVG